MDPRRRVGDTDKEQAVAALQQYATDGYLTLDEFSERSAAAYRAGNRGELAALTADLPPRPADPDPRHGPAAPDQPHRPAPARRGPVRWTPAAVVVAVLVGVVVVTAGIMILMMVMMPGGMGDMGGM